MAILEDKAEFFREGLLRYAEARETVTYFQTCVQEAIAAAFEAKSTWAHFIPTRTEPDQRLEVGKGMGVVFIQSYIAGTIPCRAVNSKVWLSLGVYWNAPLKPSSVVAASHCWLDAGPWVPFRSVAAGREVSVAALYKKNERRLVVPAGEGFDPETSFGLLLDATDEALGPLEAAPSA